LACHDESFVNSPLDVKENDECALDIACRLSCFFGLDEFGLFHSDTHLWFILSFPDTCPGIAQVSVTLFPRFAQNLMHIHCWIHHEIASDQMHDSN
jgi:hypothetical protein